MKRRTFDARGVRVVVVRHGPAEPRDAARWPNDDRRPLTRKGKVQTQRAAEGLARLASPVARLACSAADRAFETAELVAGALHRRPDLEMWPELAPGNFPEPIFTKLRRAARPGQEVLLVGHEPTLAEFLGMALPPGDPEELHLTKGGAACLEFPRGVRPGAGRLLWLYTRKELAGQES